MTRLGRVGVTIARTFTTFGLSTLRPASDPPPDALLDLIAPHKPPGDLIAVARTNQRDRWIVLTIDSNHGPNLLLKVAMDKEGRDALSSEAEGLRRFRKRIHPPLRQPNLLNSSDGVLVFRFVPWLIRRHPWYLPTGVATSLGYLARSNCEKGELWAHGDFAPWNLLKTDSGWVLIDWESCTDNAPPYYDVLHFLVQGHALLNRPNLDQLLDGFRGEGWIGQAIHSYSEAAGVGPLNRSMIEAYLSRSLTSLDAETDDGSRGLKARALIAHRLGLEFGGA